MPDNLAQLKFHELVPRVTARSQKRRTIHLSDADYERYREACNAFKWEGAPLTAVWVTDHRTGHEVKLKAAPCGLRCYCDAVIVGQRRPKDCPCETCAALRAHPEALRVTPSLADREATR